MADYTKPVPGEQAICGMCRERIMFVGPYWDHMGENKSRHPAIPEDEWKPAPISKKQAFDALLNKLDAAGVKDKAPIVEALYVYREALLRWQREMIDQPARDAELAIGILRGYTWIMLLDPTTHKVSPVYVEPNLIVSQFKLPCKPLDS